MLTAAAVLRRSQTPAAAVFSRPPAPRPAAINVALNPKPNPQASTPGVASVVEQFPVAPSDAAPFRSPSEPAKKSSGRAMTSRTAVTSHAVAPVAGPVPVVAALEQQDVATKMAASEPLQAAPTPFSASPAGVESPPVTISGCLEISVAMDEYRLTDTEGTDAPTSRGWRTGFLLKRRTSVALVDPPDPHQLKTHVGKRVAAVGLLTGRELRANSVRVIDASCD
jgi:hypothetical protein